MAAKPVPPKPVPPKPVAARPAAAKPAATAPRAATRRVVPIAILGAVVLVAVAAGAYYMRSGLMRSGFMRDVHPVHESPTAQAWTVLQTVEAEHRSDADRDSAVLLPNADHSSYTLLGLPTGSPRLPRAWIILNQRSPGARMKMIPANAHVHVSCAYVEQILKSADVEPPVKSFLRARCTPGSVAAP